MAATKIKLLVATGGEMPFVFETLNLDVLSGAIGLVIVDEVIGFT